MDELLLCLNLPEETGYVTTAQTHKDQKKIQIRKKALYEIHDCT